MDTLSDEFFNEIVERKLNLNQQKFKIHFVLILPATGKNENFVSDVYRAKIKVEILKGKQRKFIDVIIKALITVSKEVKECGVFPREIVFYKDIKERFENIWKEIGHEIITFTPECLAIRSEPDEIIALDDLKTDGFEVIDRKIGADLDQSKVFMNILAKFHAGSAVQYHKIGKISTFLDRNLSFPKLPKDGPFGDSIKKMYIAFLNTVKQLNIPQNCVTKISHWNPEKLMDAMHNGCEPMKCGFTVLNHGDIWINNIMFKLNENGNAIDVKLIDFQLSYWGSSVADLLYFMISSVRDDVKVAHFDDIIQYYHTALDMSLKKLKYDKHIPSLKELIEDMDLKKNSIFSNLIDGLFFCKYSFDKEIHVPDMFNGKMSAEEIRLMFEDENFMKSLEILLPFLEKRGFLDL